MCGRGARSRLAVTKLTHLNFCILHLYSSGIYLTKSVHNFTNRLRTETCIYNVLLWLQWGSKLTAHAQYAVTMAVYGVAMKLNQKNSCAWEQSRHQRIPASLILKDDGQWLTQYHSLPLDFLRSFGVLVSGLVSTPQLKNTNWHCGILIISPCDLKLCRNTCCNWSSAAGVTAAPTYLQYM